MTVTMSVVVAVLIRVIVRRGGRADLLLETGESHAVNAHVAVHADVAWPDTNPDEPAAHARTSARLAARTNRCGNSGVAAQCVCR